MSDVIFGMWGLNGCEHELSKRMRKSTYLDSSEMWRRMIKLRWTDGMINEELVTRIGREIKMMK